MRLATVSLIATCAVATSVSAQAPATRRAPPAPTRVASPALEILDLGVIGAAPQPSQTLNAPRAARPTRQAMVNTLQQKFAPGIDVGETYRITPKNLESEPIAMTLVGSNCTVDTRYDEGYVNCVNMASITFGFSQLSPNARYLVTIEHNFGRVDLRTTSGGKEQVTQVSPQGQPILLVFQTPANANTATLRLEEILSGTPSNTVFYALELSRVQ